MRDGRLPLEPVARAAGSGEAAPLTRAPSREEPGCGDLQPLCPVPWGGAQEAGRPAGGPPPGRSVQTRLWAPPSHSLRLTLRPAALRRWGTHAQGRRRVSPRSAASGQRPCPLYPMTCLDALPDEPRGPWDPGRGRVGLRLRPSGLGLQNSHSLRYLGPGVSHKRMSLHMETGVGKKCSIYQL